MSSHVQGTLIYGFTKVCSLAVGVVLISVLYCIARAIIDPQRKLPGPFLARFSRLWYLGHVHQAQQNFTELDLHRKYGPIVRLAPGQYSLNNPSAAKAIYDHGSGFSKSDFYAPFGTPDPHKANVFQEQNIEAHALKRRRIASLYSMTSIVSYEPFVDNCIQAFMKQLGHFAETKVAINVPSWMQYYAFDVIGAITIGNPYGFLTHGYDFPGIIGELQTTQIFASHLGSFAGAWYQYIAPMVARLSRKPPFMASHRYMQTNLQKKLLDIENGKSLQETTGKQDFAEKLLAMKAQGKVSETDLQDCVRANIAAGSDTTGVSLSAILYLLLRNPEALLKLRAEVDKQKAMLEDTARLITYSQAQAMPYLQAVIKEALRLHPAIGMQMPRIVPKGGAHLAGHFFPAGTIVGVNAWVLHAHPEIFGENVDHFRPERWLEDEEKSKNMERSLLTFGAGSHTCLGKNVSMLEMQKLIPELVYRYDFDFVDASKEWESFSRFFVYKKYECFVRQRLH